MFTPDRDEVAKWEVPYGDVKAIITRDPIYGMFEVHLDRGRTPEELQGRWTILSRCMHHISMTAQRRGKKEVIN